MKYLVVIPDGMADEKIASLGDLTPMEKASKPCMDSLVKKAYVGTVSNVPAGMVPESDTANLAILSLEKTTWRCTKKSAARRAKSLCVTISLRSLRFAVTSLCAAFTEELW